jgi:hypothetical protein
MAMQDPAAAAGVAARLAFEPNLADAAAHPIRLVMGLGGQRLQRMAEFDQIAVAVIPIVEEGEISADGFDRSQGAALGWRGLQDAI